MLDRFQADQTDRFEHVQVLDVFLAKGHPEADLFQAFNMFDQAFFFFVIDEVRHFRADFRIVDHRAD